MSIRQWFSRIDYIAAFVVLGIGYFALACGEWGIALLLGVMLGCEAFWVYPDVRPDA